MSLRSLEYAITESFTAIRRNVVMSLASIVTVALSLGILGGFVLFAMGLNNITQAQMEKFEMQVFLKKGTPDDSLKKLENKIESLPNVQSVQLIRADDAWHHFKKEMGKQIDLSGVSGNPLGDSFRVKVVDPRYIGVTSKLIRHMPRVEVVNEGQRVVEQVVRFSDLVKFMGIGVAVLLFLIAAFIVSNTIRLVIYAKRREITIMQLVGATNWFIRLPLVFEGTILGMIGGGIAYLMVSESSYYLSKWVVKILGPLNPLCHFSSNVDPLYFLGSLVVTGWIIGAIGSLISIQRFLRA